MRGILAFMFCAFRFTLCTWTMTIYLASDHAGYDLKETLKPFLLAEGCTVRDLGPQVRDLTDDYPDFIIPLARAVAADPDARGIIIGGSGEGEAMAANRIRGARACVLYSFNEKIIRVAREHNSANILSLGARFLVDEEAKAIVRLWLATPFSGESRHVRRIEKLDSLT